jgi:glycosyltransferase involved in cell wall biosynthesis
LPLADRVRLRLPRAHDDPERLGNLMILKRHDRSTGEKGVLLVAFNYSILDLPAVFDLPALAQRYMFVLEPSWWGYEDARFFLYVGSDVDVVVEAQRLHDHDFVRSSHTNLVPLRLGAGDWADPRTFAPGQRTGRTYDVAMVAGWDPFKRHELLFRTLERIRVERGRRMKVALVGYPMSWTRSQVERLVRQHGLEQDCAVFERIPHGEVARILADSRMSVLLSRGEGANKAMYESFFCGTPVIVTRGHLGVNLDHVTPQSGRLASDEELGDAILDLADRPETLDPRGWAVENTGWPVATRVLEDALKAISARRGTPWTRGIVPRMKAPGNRYAEPGKHEELAAEYDRIARYLLPT